MAYAYPTGFPNFPTTSPVSKLTEDILWTIFMFNAVNYEPLDIDQPDEDSETYHLPLDTTRSTSQVCRKWRHLLLDTSSVWGRLMDWRSLNQESDHWRNEVLRRSGTSMIWIEGHADEDEDPKECTLMFFHRLVVEHWERIERLSCFSTQYSHIEDLQRAVERPAPNLKVFTFPDSPGDYHDFSGSIFSGYAPRLEAFYAMESRCTLDATWMLNIRELSLGRLFNNKTVCHVLKHLPRLESLELDSHTIIDGYRPPRIRLHNLRTLKLWGCISYLIAIEPAPGCALFLWNEWNADMLPFYDKYITKILHQFLSLHPPRQLYLEFRKSTFTISERQFPRSIYTHRREPIFDVSLSLDPQSSINVLEHLLTMLSSPLFSTTTDLWISCDALDFGVIHAFKRFASFFPTMQNLWAREDDLHILLQCEMSTPNSLVLPSIQTIVILGLSSLQNTKSSCIASLASLEIFLMSRRRFGAPLLTVHLTECCLLRSTRNLDSLEQFVGMRVRWKKDGNMIEYECGNGHPECLQFF